MGTGIVSIDLHLLGDSALSLIALGIAALAWLLLALLLVERFVLDRARFAREAVSPPALTGVAGTAVLGTRLVLLGWDGPASVLLVFALLLWLGLVVPILRHWITPTVGASFILVVSTEAIAVLAVSVAAATRATWLFGGALTFILLGLVLYVLVVTRFDVGQLLVGLGDHWVAGGALAISALACAKLTQTAHALSVLTAANAGFTVVTTMIWVLALCWLPVLVVCEFISPRLTYNVRRWSTVFPVGMYAACSFVVGGIVHSSVITDFARIWTWVALGVWLIALVAMVAQLPAVMNSPPPSADPASRAESAHPG
jgi:tellurite resistance protein TehA-like permease